MAVNLQQTNAHYLVCMTRGTKVFITLLLGATVYAGAGCNKVQHPEPELPTPETLVLPNLPETPYGYAEMQFPEAWLNDPALALFGGPNTDDETEFCVLLTVYNTPVTCLFRPPSLFLFLLQPRRSFPRCLAVVMF